MAKGRPCSGCPACSSAMPTRCRASVLSGRSASTARYRAIAASRLPRWCWSTACCNRRRQSGTGPVIEIAVPSGPGLFQPVHDVTVDGDQRFDIRRLPLGDLVGMFVDEDADVDERDLEVFGHPVRSEEHTSELQSLMRISYAVFCLKKKKYNTYISTQQV